MNPDEQAIRDLIATWMRASKAGDTATVLRLMAEDVAFLRPGHEPMRGRAAFAASQQQFQPFRFETTGEIREIRILGDWAYCWSWLKLVVTPTEGAEPVERSGDILSILSKESGSWVIVRDANMLAAAQS